MMRVSIEPWRLAEPPDDEYPQCGACDEYGHPIRCDQCIWDGRCALQPYNMEKEDEDESE